MEGWKCSIINYTICLEIQAYVIIDRVTNYSPLCRESLAYWSKVRGKTILLYIDHNVPRKLGGIRPSEAD